MEHYNYEQICKYLYGLIPQEEWKRLEVTLGEMCHEFLGFCDTYYYLSMLIPKDWTIIDFGAGNNPQSYFFTEHKCLPFVTMFPTGIEKAVWNL